MMDLYLFSLYIMFYYKLVHIYLLFNNNLFFFICFSWSSMWSLDWYATKIWGRTWCRDITQPSLDEHGTTANSRFWEDAVLTSTESISSGDIWKSSVALCEIWGRWHRWLLRYLIVYLIWLRLISPKLLFKSIIFMFIVTKLFTNI